jgi:hypothetical protein
MSENTLATKITLDIVDLVTKAGVAKAEVSALTAEFNKLAKQSAAGLLDPAGLASLQDASRAMLEAKNSAKELQEQLKGVHEESLGFGGAIKEMGSNLNAALEVTGIGIAIEGFHKLGEVIEDLGGRAVQIQSLSEILGVTAEELQTMQLAAEEAGVSTEVLARAAERLKVILFEARDGSGAAVEKLKALGVTTEQIADPTFQVNELLGVLHDRLKDASTEQDTMNQLIKDFGPRAALAAEAIKNYDGSFAGVKKSMAEVNGLTDEQVHHLVEVHSWWGKVGTAIKNAASEYALWVADIVTTANEVGEREKAARAPGADPNVAADAKADARQKLVEKEIAAIQLVTKADLDADKDAIAATKQGSAERLAAVQQYALQAAVFYGQNVDKVREADRQVIAEARASNEELIREASKAAAEQMRLTREAIKAEDEHVKKTLSGIASMIDADGRYLADQQHMHDAIRSMEQTGLELQTKIWQERAKTSAELTKITQKETQEQLARWQGVSNAIQTSLGSAFKGMLSGGETFGQGMRNVATSIADSFLNMAAKNITTMLMQAAVGNTLRAKEIQKDAGAAAAGAYKSVVGIPYVGVVLAPLAAAAAYTAVLAFDSAEGGWDVPTGVNPVTQLHEREMVLPRQQADVIRTMADQGGGKGGRPVHIHGKPDSKFTGDQLASMLKELGHRFVFS